LEDKEMGIAEYLAFAAVLILIGVIALLYSSAQAQAAATQAPPLASVPNAMAHGGRYARPATPSAGYQTPRSAGTPPGGFHQPKWQYKYKDVPKYNPELGRCQMVQELVLVFE
jgi:hypothetical protein